MASLNPNPLKATVASPATAVAKPGTLDLTVVIPAHNEEHAAGPTVESVRAVLETLSLSYEIIVVDDGSRDGTLGRGRTRRRTRHGVAGQSRLRMGAEARHRGQPFALRRDPRCRRNLSARSVARSSRTRASRPTWWWATAATAMSNVPWIRRPAKWVLSKLANFLARQKIPDLIPACACSTGRPSSDSRTASGWLFVHFDDHPVHDLLVHAGRVRADRLRQANRTFEDPGRRFLQLRPAGSAHRHAVPAAANLHAAGGRAVRTRTAKSIYDSR